MQEMIPGHLIPSSLTEQGTHMYQVAGKKSSEGLKETVPDAFFFLDDNFLYRIATLHNLKLSLLHHQDISHISRTALLILKSLGKHLQFRSMTFKLSKWSPLVFLCRLLMPLGMGEQKFLAGFHDPKD